MPETFEEQDSQDKAELWDEDKRKSKPAAGEPAREPWEISEENEELMEDDIDRTLERRRKLKKKTFVPEEEVDIADDEKLENF